LSTLVAADNPVGDASATRRRQPTKWRLGTPSSAPGNTVKRASRSAVGNGGQRRRAAHVPPKPDRRPILPAPFRGAPASVRPRGWINLTTLPPASRLGCSCSPSRFGDPKGGTIRTSSAMGFNPAVEPVRAHPGGLRRRGPFPGFGSECRHQCRRGRHGLVPGDYHTASPAAAQSEPRSRAPSGRARRTTRGSGHPAGGSAPAGRDGQRNPSSAAELPTVSVTPSPRSS
jgi:hypothetical protein